MKDAKHLDHRVAVAMQIGDAIVAVVEHAHLTFRHGAEAGADVGVIDQQFCLGDDTVDDFGCRG